MRRDEKSREKKQSERSRKGAEQSQRKGAEQRKAEQRKEAEQRRQKQKASPAGLNLQERCSTAKKWQANRAEKGTTVEQSRAEQQFFLGKRSKFLSPPGFYLRNVRNLEMKLIVHS